MHHLVSLSMATKSFSVLKDAKFSSGIIYVTKDARFSQALYRASSEHVVSNHGTLPCPIAHGCPDGPKSAAAKAWSRCCWAMC